MELVPILSTIILVGTVATFLLAVFAYIMYKWRERHVSDDGRVVRPRDQEPHVLVAPTLQVAEPQPRPVAVPPKAAAAPEMRPPSAPRESLFWEYTDQGFVPVRPRSTSAGEAAEPAGAVPNGDGGSAWI